MGQGEDISGGGAAGEQMELQAHAWGGGGQGEDRIYGAAAGGHLKTAMNKIAGKS